MNKKVQFLGNKRSSISEDYILQILYAKKLKTHSQIKFFMKKIKENMTLIRTKTYKKEYLELYRESSI